MRTIFAVFVLALVIPAVVYGQGSQTPSTQSDQDRPGAQTPGVQRGQDRPGAQTRAGQQSQQRSEFAEGELQRVDARQKTLWIKTMDGQELQIKYDEGTMVQGADAIAEGLGSARGHSLRVQYREQGNEKIAVLIDVQEAGAQRRPGSPSGVQRQSGSQPGQGSDPGSQRSY